MKGDRHHKSSFNRCKEQIYRFLKNYSQGRACVENVKSAKRNSHRNRLRIRERSVSAQRFLHGDCGVSVSP
jgi:hypothetical protein